MTDTDTPAPILAAAMSDAEFDGRPFPHLGRVDRERYIERATRAHGQAVKATLAMAKKAVDELSWKLPMYESEAMNEATDDAACSVKAQASVAIESLKEKL
jgi:hypothetical protein